MKFSTCLTVLLVSLGIILTMNVLPIDTAISLLSGFQAFGDTTLGKLNSARTPSKLLQPSSPRR